MHKLKRKYVNGYEYIGQYADKYYLINIIITDYESHVLIYDKTKDMLKNLKVAKNRSVRINGEYLSIDSLNG